MYQKILQLLAHEDEANVLLGLEIASGITHPESIDEEVFHLAYFHPSQEVNTRALQFLNEQAHIDMSKMPSKTWGPMSNQSRYWHSSIEAGLILDWLEALPVGFELINAGFLNKVLQQLNIEQRAGQVFLFCIKHQISVQAIPDLIACTQMSFYLDSHQRYEYDRKLPKHTLQTLPKEIGQMTNLTHLILDNHQLTELPEEIGELTQLNYLYLNHNALTRLPSSFAKLTSLVRLELSHNPLASFPAEILSCKRLHTLWVKNCGFEALPTNINQLNHLETLDLGYNQLPGLPRQFRHLTKLRDINLSNNQLDKLPAFFIKFTQLTHLNLANNKIERLPGRFSQLHNLTDLDLRNNRLKYWHFSGHALFNLKWLDLSDNQLTRLIPTTIGLLASLECLRVNDNPLPRQELAQFKARFPEIYMLPLIPPREWGKYPRALISGDLASKKVPVNLSYQGKFTVEFDISSTEKYIKLSW